MRPAAAQLAVLLMVSGQSRDLSRGRDTRTLDSCTECILLEEHSLFESSHVLPHGNGACLQG